MSKQALTNYVAYIEGPQNLSRIGYLDFEASTIQPLSFASGTPIRDLYQVIEVGEANIAAGGGRIPLSSVKLLPPISGRDVLAVGKNYIDHAKEFNRSGFDSSDKVDQPAHPVIFTKRSTSIIASGDPIVLVPEFTQTLDYEGEIGVVIGKPGFRIPEKCAMDYVWGYTIINDITARERQRDHKQFYLGKSGDTYCPMVSCTEAAKNLRPPHLDVEESKRFMS
jgi:2-keto-4-pentenoate hydratase/2-oxohepta-3-ene-1,7-dioic acid hydratase in catechol pathway